MALSFSIIHRGQEGGKATRYAAVTLDGSTVLISPANLEMNGILFATITPKASLTGSATWDAGAIADGDEEAKEVTVTGAAMGDYAVASLGVDISDLTLDAQITSTNIATCILQNSTGGSINLASTTVKAMVFKPCGISSIAEATGITFGPAGTSGDVVYVRAVGY